MSLMPEWLGAVLFTKFTKWATLIEKHEDRNMLGDREEESKECSIESRHSACWSCRQKVFSLEILKRTPPLVFQWMLES